jgi:hypothetical protein
MSTNDAAAKLQDLARCRRITLFQAGDEEELCGSCLLPIIWRGGHWEHDPAVIRRLRAATYDDRWPSR